MADPTRSSSFRPGDWPPPDIDSRLAILEQRMAEAGYPVKIVPKTGRYRSAEEQARIYAKGRTTMGSGRPTPDRPFGGTVTQKSGKPGEESLHQLGNAADYIFTGGRENWQLLGQTAKELGLEWGGDWKDPYDPGHVQQVARGVLNATRPARAQAAAGGVTDPASARVTEAAAPLPPPMPPPPGKPVPTPAYPLLGLPPPAPAPAPEPAPNAAPGAAAIASAATVAASAVIRFTFIREPPSVPAPPYEARGRGCSHTAAGCA